MSQMPVRFKQWAEPWGKEPYSNHNDRSQTIGRTGSGPTLAADVVATLKDPSVTPSTMAKLALGWGNRTYMAGTDWGYFANVASHFGFQRFVQLREWEALKECLDAGGYAICSMTQGYWCKVPCYILAWGYDDEYVYAFDAATDKRNKQPVDRFKAESRMYFCFYPDKEGGYAE